ncbi:ribosomal protein S7 [Suillus brevipes Sb2]|nr:ribosomal protein S7 [Suillus brevipes Sb2]
MLIPPASDPLLHFLASSLLNHGKRARAERIVSRTLLYIQPLTRAPPLPILRHALITASPAINKSGKTVEERLAREIIAAVNGDSKTIADKELAHRQAMVNRGNALVK